jgi:tRNA (guanine37-N1)-methyltransferase
VPGVVGNEESLSVESFEDEGRLDHPQYTRPRTVRGMEVPDVLLSGDHGAIAAWRRETAARKTRRNRPDLAPSGGEDATGSRPEAATGP